MNYVSFVTCEDVNIKRLCSSGIHKENLITLSGINTIVEYCHA